MTLTLHPLVLSRSAVHGTIFSPEPSPALRSSERYSFALLCEANYSDTALRDLLLCSPWQYVNALVYNRKGYSMSRRECLWSTSENEVSSLASGLTVIGHILFREVVTSAQGEIDAVRNRLLRGSEGELVEEYPSARLVTAF